MRFCKEHNFSLDNHISIVIIKVQLNGMLRHFQILHALAGFLVIQWMYNYLQDDEFNRVVRLKFQITGHIC
jgi:hypothetical protein